MDKKKIIIIVISIILVISAIVTSTYSLFYSESVSSNPENYSTGLLSIVATSKSDTISLSSALPINDEEGKESIPYTFTIKNIGNLDYKFDIKLLSTSANTISPQYIKLQIDDGEVNTLSNLSNSIIKNNIILKAKESIDITIRVWLSIDTPNTEIGKVFNSKLVADGQAIYTDTNYNVTAVDYITSLYTNATKTVVTNNDIEYNYATSVSLMNDRLGGTTSNYDGGNIRYYGAIPNNYVYFNCDDYSNQTSSTCELWRIIGVFDGKLKLIRNESIGSYSWDTSASTVNLGRGINEWSQANIMKLLNPEYANNIDLDNEGNDIVVNNSLYWNSGSGTCYRGQNYLTISCDFSKVGLRNDETKSMISDALWYLGGYSNSAIYANQSYTYERETNVIQNPSDGVARTTTWVGKVGLMYPSDYGYATDFTKCSENLKNYNSSNDSYACRTTDYLFTGYTQWMITPKSNSSTYIWYIPGNGGLYEVGNIPTAPYNFRPTLYLASTLNFKAGTGSIDSPYQLLVE